MKTPIYFLDYSLCLHCGQKAVVPVGINGIEMDGIKNNPVFYMYCKSCNTKYKIRWIKKNSELFELVPTLAYEDIIEETADNIIAMTKE